MNFDQSKTKIIATLGPASSDKKILRKMFLSGLDVCRINFSHSSHEAAGEIIKTIHELNEETSADVAILADLQGPKLRVGEMKNGQVFLEKGSVLEFVNEKKILTPYIKLGKCFYIMHEKVEFITVFEINHTGLWGFQISGNMV